MRTAPVSLLCILALAYGCGEVGTTEKTGADTYWEGEVRILPGDTAFTPCGSTTPVRLTGPGLDSIAHRYTYLNTATGQWVKTWLSGRMTLPVAAKDSVLQAMSYMHMDSEVNCPPVPNEQMEGKYVSLNGGGMGIITTQVMLLHGGDAVLTTTAPDSPMIEDDGTWGLDADRDLVLEIPKRHATFYFTWEKGGLRSHLPNGAPGPAYKLMGPADRMEGTFGRTAMWLAAVATGQGDTLRAESLRPDMSLDSLFPTPAAREALRASAPDTLGMTEQKLNSLWGSSEQVKDVNALMRTHLMEVR
ncbi:MAG: hypothetical protein IPP95_13180 [Flavobacteriales bacterium]|nr:MAG: hypothetical protein IPP95_13180 [Flavobacteriales bacterium]